MSIDLYVSQLTEDIRQAARINLVEKENNVDNSKDSFEQHIQEVENYIYGTAIPLSQILGISTIQLPSPDQLSNEQQAALYKEIEILLNAFNFYPGFPDNLPGHFKYQVIRKHWDDEHVHMNYGQSHMEFCDYEPKGCPFPSGFCRCKEINF